MLVWVPEVVVETLPEAADEVEAVLEAEPVAVPVELVAVDAQVTDAGRSVTPFAAHIW